MGRKIHARLGCKLRWYKGKQAGTTLHTDHLFKGGRPSFFSRIHAESGCRNIVREPTLATGVQRDKSTCTCKEHMEMWDMWRKEETLGLPPHPRLQSACAGRLWPCQHVFAAPFGNWNPSMCSVALSLAHSVSRRRGNRGATLV